VARRTTPEQTIEAICVLAPTSPLIRDLRYASSKLAIEYAKLRFYESSHLVIEPKAGNVPGTNEPARLAAPRATSSRFGLIE